MIAAAFLLDIIHTRPAYCVANELLVRWTAALWLASFVVDSSTVAGKFGCGQAALARKLFFSLPLVDIVK
jgi:hypothetical protein